MNKKNLRIGAIILIGLALFYFNKKRKSGKPSSKSSSGGGGGGLGGGGSSGGATEEEADNGEDQAPIRTTTDLIGVKLDPHSYPTLYQPIDIKVSSAPPPVTSTPTEEEEVASSPMPTEPIKTPPVISTPTAGMEPAPAGESKISVIKNDKQRSQLFTGSGEYKKDKTGLYFRRKNVNRDLFLYSDN